MFNAEAVIDVTVKSRLNAEPNLNSETLHI
jgi:hypothetical protein